ncbi:recombinase family protein, partial [Acinetobacter baumannii]|uniref:recombinase family protein n=1 Tax=Acinetobacter baumannii TaxID=470 RepID=UPI00201862B2
MQMIGAFAEFERNLIRERVTAGIASAKARGVRLGRAPALDEAQVADCVEKFRDGRYPTRQFASLFG